MSAANWQLVVGGLVNLEYGLQNDMKALGHGRILGEEGLHKMTRAQCTHWICSRSLHDSYFLSFTTGYMSPQRHHLEASGAASARGYSFKSHHYKSRSSFAVG